MIGQRHIVNLMYDVCAHDTHTVQASQEQQLDCALDLMRRLPPQDIEKNLSDLIDLVRESVLWNKAFF